MVHSVEQSLRIKALEHLIEEEFDSPRACHAVCHLLTQLFSGSEDETYRMVANLADKALQSSVEMRMYN